MSERRQAFRREPIEIDLTETFTLSVAPIPWEQRNEFGNEVVKQHTAILNDAIKVYTDPESNLPQLETALAEKIRDPGTLLKLGLDEVTYGLLDAGIGMKKLYKNQTDEILLAICDVNGLEQIKPLIDPNSLAPATLGGMIDSLKVVAGIEDEEDTPKIESGPDSSQPESPETQLEGSPIPSLTPS